MVERKRNDLFVDEPQERNIWVPRTYNIHMSNSTAVNMTYRFQMNDEILVTLPDVICSELGFQLGDILIREVTDNASKLTLRKHRVQTLTDDEIALNNCAN